MTETKSDDGSDEIDTLIAELEKESLPEGSESKPIVEKQIQRAKDENHDENYDVGDKEFEDASEDDIFS